ncbi:MAG: sodium:solute symporter [Calditrichaeota bacterium]|nr:sodium:solute symporter [Calditrichota bacterium]
MGFSGLDIAIVVVYMLISTLVGAYIGRNQTSTSDYFLGGRQIPWYAVTFSIVATETSVLTFIGMPGIAYLGNLTFLQLALGYIVGRFLVAYLLLPAYYRGDIFTAYHYLEQRFGRGMRQTASTTFMVTRLLADGVRLFATAIPLALILQTSGMFSDLTPAQVSGLAIFAIGLLTIFYTYFGGIKSVIWMDVVQMAVYIGGALLALYLMLDQLPDGFASVTAAAAPQDKLAWLNWGAGLSWSEFIKQPYTFFTALFGGAVFSLASHGTDQLIVQRVLTCKDLRASRLAITTSGVAVFLQFVLFLIIGSALFAFYQGASLQDLGQLRADGIFPKFIVEEMPNGVRGLLVAALFAAAMSTLSSSLSSLSSAAVLDIYAPLFGDGKSEADLLRISRRVTLLWGFVLMGAALFFMQFEGGTVVELALGIASYTYGGLLGSFLLGLVIPAAGQRDAIIAFVVALVTMTLLIRYVQIAWPLYTVVGSLTTILVGWISSKLRSGAMHAG